MLIPLDKIEISDCNIRKTSGLVDVTELADSMETLGLIQPIVARPKDDGYDLIVGQRRFLAARQLGWKEIEATVRDLDDKTALAFSLKENKDRTDVDPFDYAHGVKRYRECCKTVKEAYEGLGMSESYYYRWMELLGLEPIIKKVKAERRVSPVGEITERGLRDYTPFKYVYEDEPEKLEELIEETIDLKPLERKRVLNHVKAFPKEPIKVKEILARPEPIMLTIQFSATVATGLEEAAEDRFTSREDIVKIATEDWLKENEYLEEE